MMARMFSPTCPASSPLPVRIEVGVGRVVGMSLWAMCFKSVLGRKTDASQNINFHRDNLDMARADARVNATEMVGLHPIWNMQKESVSLSSLAMQEEAPVTLGSFHASPNPTGTEVRAQRRDRSVLVDFRPEAWLWRKILAVSAITQHAFVDTSRHVNIISQGWPPLKVK